VSGNELGTFSTWGAGIAIVVKARQLTAQLAYTQTGSGCATQSPWGDHPSYANLMQSAFNAAGEKAWVALASYDFGQIATPGLSAGVAYGQGRNQGNALPDQRETDVRADYAFQLGKDHPLHGLSAGFRYSWLDQDGTASTATELRAYVNYEVTFR